MPFNCMVCDRTDLPLTTIFDVYETEGKLGSGAITVCNECVQKVRSEATIIVDEISFPT
jgi:transcription elongation factor Elf1